MKKLTKHISATACSVLVASVAVLGAGGAASAATPVTTHAQRPAVSAKATDYRWDHGVGYLLEEGYTWDRIRGWHHDDSAIDSAWHGRDGHSHRWDDKECDWKSDRSHHRYDWNRYEHEGRNWHHHDRNHGDW
ncbi:hypothetical protein ABZ468_35455 [Streptomyces sp. NPDC005708]|uniref:hypothetical protein n=1 Tax=unclassified Streptomyces TaxID=2593676 RepID=UPI0033FB348E